MGPLTETIQYYAESGIDKIDANLSRATPGNVAHTIGSLRMKLYDLRAVFKALTKVPISEQAEEQYSKFLTQEVK